MKNYLFSACFLLIFLSITLRISAQVGINSDGSQPDPSAGLDVKFTNKGLLPPRMSYNQLNAIVNPASGLTVFCDDCGLNGGGAMAMFINGAWYLFNTICLNPKNPIAGVHVSSFNQIIWNWMPTIGANGYKWNIINDYNSANDLGLVTTTTETGLLCNLSYTRYLWAYNVCGTSIPTILSASNLFIPLPPTIGIHVPSINQIVWNWNFSEGALGYKWNTINDFASATNMGNSTSKIETDLTCSMGYTRYVWAYNDCGNSSSSTLNQMTNSCSGYPTITTSAATNITSATTTCGGDVISDGGTMVLFRGVCWNISQSPTISNNHTTDGSGLGVFSSNLTNLTSNTFYYIRAYATNNGGTAYGNEISFMTLPSVVTTAVTEITQTTAVSGGNVDYGGGNTVTSRGVCWSTFANPTITDNHTTDGGGTGTFISNLTGLIGNTTYFVRAYAVNITGTTYGNQETFNTSPLLPSVTTTSVSLITLTTAASGGNVTSNGGADVTVRGVCWSILPNPTIADNITTDGSGGGVFISSMTNLISNTLYYVKAYATNSVGTAYGNELTYTTQLNPTLPTIITIEASNILPTTATSGGNVLSDGGSVVVFRGVCWNTNPNPTTSDNHTTDGSGTGLYVSNLTGLIMNTIYYLRAYAINSIGTAYGNEVSFSFICGQPFTDTRNGYVYNTIYIGSQCWMKENINIGTQVSGVVEQTNNNVIEKYCYGNIEANCTIYGGLYQWNEIMQYVTTPGAQGICPIGWHIATNPEWSILIDLLGGESVAGGKMKEVGTNHWLSPNNGATNESGFTALPGSTRNTSGNFVNLTRYANFWTSTENSVGSTNALYPGLYYLDGVVYRNNNVKSLGFSGRCLQDN